MDRTARMMRLLAAMRRERNGAVADAMCFRGKPYGLNYGVSLPTVRALARAEGCDHGFARYLYAQDVRELKLAACSMADPAVLDVAEAEYWGAGMLNSEMAEELAFALLSRAPGFDRIYAAWMAPGRSALRRYAALMAAARAPRPDVQWLDAAGASVLRESGGQSVARATVALVEHLARSGADRKMLDRFLVGLGTSETAEWIRGEVSWRLAYC